VSPPLGLRLEDGGGITPFWRVMIALTGLGMVALAALLLLTCSWAKPKHLIVGKVSPTRTAGEARPHGGGGGDAVPSDGSGRGDGGDGDGSGDAFPGDPAVPVAAEGGSCAPQE